MLIMLFDWQVRRIGKSTESRLCARARERKVEFDQYSLDVLPATCMTFFSKYLYSFTKEMKLGNEKCASNREHTYIQLMCCLFVDLSALFICTYVYREAQCARQHKVQIDEKNIETTALFSRSFAFFPRWLTCLRLTLTIRSQYYDDYTLFSMIIIISKTSNGRDEHASAFCFIKMGIARLDVDIVFSAIEHFTCSCLCVMLCVCVYGGQILFPVNCGGRSRFFPFFFSRTLTHAVHFLFPLFYCQKSKTRNIFILHIYIHTYFNSFFCFFSIIIIVVLCHNSSFPFTSILFIAYLFSFYIIHGKKTFFYFPSSSTSSSYSFFVFLFFFF